MTDRHFRLFIGAVLLIALYFELQYLFHGVIGLLVLEGVTNWRVAVIVSRLVIAGSAAGGYCASDTAPGSRVLPIPFEAERAWRLLVAALLLLSSQVFHDHLWWLPWFIGFATLGAGLSGVCPALMAIRRLGFR